MEYGLQSGRPGLKLDKAAQLKNKNKNLFFNNLFLSIRSLLLETETRACTK